MLTSFCSIPQGLTIIIKALEAFQDFEPEIRRAAIIFHAAKLDILQLQFYASTDLAGLEVA
jgi:hypothetical protein